MSSEIDLDALPEARWLAGKGRAIPPVPADAMPRVGRLTHPTTGVGALTQARVGPLVGLTYK